MGSRFLETCSLRLGCRICWHRLFIVFLMCFFFKLLWYQLLHLLFHFLFCLLGFLLSFLGSMARSLSIIFTLSKNQLLVLLIFFPIKTKISIWFIFSLICIISFFLHKFKRDNLFSWPHLLLAISYPSGPQPFWHQGLVSEYWGEGWFYSDDSSTLHLLYSPLTSCCMAWFLTGHGLVWGLETPALINAVNKT